MLARDNSPGGNQTMFIRAFIKVSNIFDGNYCSVNYICLII